jgi:hypothetical protein
MYRSRAVAWGWDVINFCGAPPYDTQFMFSAFVRRPLLSPTYLRTNSKPLNAFRTLATMATNPSTYKLNHSM